MPLILSLFLIFCANTSKIKTSNNGENGHPCLVHFITLHPSKPHSIVYNNICSLCGVFASLAFKKVFPRSIFLKTLFINSQDTLSNASSTSRNINAACFLLCTSKYSITLIIFLTLSFNCLLAESLLMY